MAAIETFQSFQDNYVPQNNQTVNVMTKFEKTKIIGIRLEQIVRGAPPLVQVAPGMTPREIVLAELKEGVIPFMVVRTLPNGNKETYKMDDLVIN